MNRWLELALDAIGVIAIFVILWGGLMAAHVLG